MRPEYSMSNYYEYFLSWEQLDWDSKYCATLSHWTRSTITLVSWLKVTVEIETIVANWTISYRSHNTSYNSVQSLWLISQWQWYCIYIDSQSQWVEGDLRDKDGWVNYYYYYYYYWWKGDQGTDNWRNDQKCT